MTETKFEQWCLVELFGHTKIAGWCTQQQIAGNNMLRVDVPETETSPAFTKFYGNAAIYAISPIDEATGRAYADKLGVKPIETWGIQQYLDKQALQIGNGDTNDDEDDEIIG